MSEKVVCKYCGKLFSSRGIYNHEKSCSQRGNTEEVMTNLVPNKTITLTILGNQYRLVRGKDIKVPKEVAQILIKINMCR